MKKILNFVFSIFIFGIFTQVVSASFKDVSVVLDSKYYTPYAKAILWMQGQELISGYGDGTFRPDVEVTRAEMLKMLYGMLDVGNIENLKALAPFSDMDGWYYNYIRKAYIDGIVEGFLDNTFRPNNPINRAEALKVLVNGFFEDIADDLLPENYRPCYEDLGVDKSEKLQWYWQYIEVLDDFCMIPETMIIDSGFFAGKRLTRGEMAELLYRVKTVRDNSNPNFFMTSFESSLNPGEFKDFVQFWTSLVEPGESYADMTVVSVGPYGYRGDAQYNDKDIRLQFSGEVTVSGQYVLEDTACLYLDSFSLYSIPKNINDSSHDLVCFSNQDEAKELLDGLIDRQRIKVRIDNYVYNRFDDQINLIFDEAWLLAVLD